MAGLVETSVVSQEPVSLSDAVNFLKINTTQDNALIMGLIAASRQYLEGATGLYLASRNFAQYRDSFPMFPFLSNPFSPITYPFGYSLISTYPNWTYSNSNPMPPAYIKMMASPVTAISNITYVAMDGTVKTLNPGTDFSVDFVNQRLGLLPNGTWPQTAPTVNAVQVNFTAGYNAPPTPPAEDAVSTVTESANNPPEEIVSTTFVTSIPQWAWTCILLLVSHWYFNREPVTGGAAVNVPHSVEALIELNRVHDFDLLGKI
jgi:hypothetical protein